jgi:pyruvate/2-oxoglutarate/acetoin dehydrogenase E1 component
MTRKTFAEAMVDGLRYCMEEDPHFSLIGNEVLGLGPEAAHLQSLAARFSDRIHYPPTSEAGFVALAAGAVMAGVHVRASRPRQLFLSGDVVDR